MKLISTDSNFDYYLGNFQGIDIKIQKDKQTGEVYFNTEDVAKCLGHKNLNNMLQSDENITNCYLDEMNKGNVIITK